MQLCVACTYGLMFTVVDHVWVVTAPDTDSMTSYIYKKLTLFTFFCQVELHKHPAAGT